MQYITLKMVKKIYGIHEWIKGNASYIRGDVSGIVGNVSDIEGNLDDCNISEEERKKGINIKDLINS